MYSSAGNRLAAATNERSSSPLVTNGSSSPVYAEEGLGGAEVSGGLAGAAVDDGGTVSSNKPSGVIRLPDSRTRPPTAIGAEAAPNKSSGVQRDSSTSSMGRKIAGGPPARRRDGPVVR